MHAVKNGVFPGFPPYKLQSKLTYKINGRRVWYRTRYHTSYCVVFQNRIITLNENMEIEVIHQDFDVAQ